MPFAVHMQGSTGKQRLLKPVNQKNECMKKMFLILPLLCLFLLPASIVAADNTTRSRFVGKERTFSYTLGNRPITLKIVEYGRSKNVVMINLHDDETTGLKAAQS